VVLGSPAGEPKVFAWAFMLPRSLPRGGSCPDTAACPHFVLATWRSLAAASISADLPSGNDPLPETCWD
jgi:hypothetical protein